MSSSSAGNILIKDGHVSTAFDYEDLPDVEGFLSSNRGTAVRLPADIDLSRITIQLPQIETILVEFTSFADGRGFSIARQLRKTHDYKGLLIADGPLVPDQYVFALQCGFDAVKVDEATFDRQSESDWFNAMDAFELTYQRGYAFKNGPATSIFDARRTSLLGQVSNDPYFGLSAQQALQRSIQTYAGKIVLVSSLGADSVVLLHMAAQIDKNLPIIFLDTGKHFRETLSYRDMLVSDLGLTDFRNVIPSIDDLKKDDPDGSLNGSDPDTCCGIRKVAPLNKAVEGFEARITGRKRYQTPARRNMPIFEQIGRQVKVNPLAYWSAKDVTAYMRKHDLPPHPLLALGFPSIGCQPCTTRVAEGEDPRAGRWRNYDKTECGIHYINGKWEPIPEKPGVEVF